MAVERPGDNGNQDKPLTYASVNGVSLAYHDIGHGEPLVLVHANISDIRSWNPVATTLAEKFRVITYSRRYAWPNDAVEDGVADPWETHADDLGALITKLQIAPAHVLGNSTGATIGLLLARQQPELLRSLILEEPPLISLFLPKTPPSLLEVVKLAWWHPWSFFPVMHFGATVIAPTTTAFKKGDNEAALRAFSRGVLGDEFYRCLGRTRIEVMRMNIKPHRALFCYGGLPQFSEDDARKIEVRTLVMTAKETVPSQKHINRRLVELLPDATEVFIEGASHLMHEDCPEEVVRAVLKFVSVC